MTTNNAKVYTRKSDANRGAKRAHGDNWAELFQVVAVDGGFAVVAIKAPEPVKEAKPAKAAKAPKAKPAPKAKAEPVKPVVTEEVKAGVVAQVIAKELADADKPAEAAPVAVAPAPVAEPKGPAVADLVAELKARTDALQTGMKAPAKALVAVASKPKAQTPAKAAAPVEKSKGGRPISDDQVKTRRRLADWISKQTGIFTVKGAVKALRLKKMHVSNGFRWAEQTGLIERVDYKVEKRPGRREVNYKQKGAVIAKAA